MSENQDKIKKNRDGTIFTDQSESKIKMEVDKDEIKSEGDYKITPVYSYHDWCMRCGICVAFCPADVLGRKADGSPYVKNSEKCIHCETCDRLCPNFAITGAKK